MHHGTTLQRLELLHSVKFKPNQYRKGNNELVFWGVDSLSTNAGRVAILMLPSLSSLS